MAIDRSAFKATKTSTLKKTKEKEDAIIPSSNRTDFLEIEEGINKLRIYPAHPGEDSFYMMRANHWLTVEGDDGKERRTMVPNARIMCGVERDIIEEYVRAATAYLQDLGTADAEDKIAILTHWQTGLAIQYSWVVYAAKHTKVGEMTKKQFGLWEFGKSVRNQLNDLAQDEDPDEQIEFDPFTDPDKGLPVQVKYDSKKNAQNKYKLKLLRNPIPLENEELETYAEVKPLSKLFRHNYTPQTFERALQGLQLFDIEHGIDIFESEDFQTIIEKVRDQFEWDNAEQEEGKSSKKSAATVTNKLPPKTTKKVQVVEEEEEDEEEEETDIELSDMDRSQLKIYIADNKLDVKVKSSMSDDDIREAIVQAESSSEEEEEDPQEGLRARLQNRFKTKS